MILWRMAWRQLFIHKKRSVVTLLLSAFSTALLVFVTALNDGSHNQLIRSSVEVYPGYLQVTNRGFEESPGYENLIFDTSALRGILESVEGIKAHAARFETYALYSSGEQSVGAMFTAIEPENEAGVSRQPALTNT